MDQYYTAREAACVLGLKYHTFLLHVRKGIYTSDNKAGELVMLFSKNKIDEKAAANASNT